MRGVRLAAGVGVSLLGGGGYLVAFHGDYGAPFAVAATASASAKPKPPVVTPVAPAHASHGPQTTSARTTDLCQTTCTKNSACTKPEKCLLGCCADPATAVDRAQQESPVTHSGHELLTVLSGAQAVAQDATVFGGVGGQPRPATSGCAPKAACERGATIYAVFSATMGVRWADLMGFRAGPLFPAQQSCLSAVAQDNEEVQYDHALRRRADAGPAGGLRAIHGIRQRLAERFKSAVNSHDGIIEIADGGGAQDHFNVIRSFFLLGRALHIVQDSFSTFHTERRAPDFAELVQVNSYVCTPGAPPHPHVMPGVLNLFKKDESASNGDVVRNAGCTRDDIACLKPEYVASVTASKEIWLAFARARAVPLGQRAQAAEREIQAFLDRWLKVPARIPVVPASSEPCDVDSVATINARRQACLRMTGRGEGLDAPFTWHRTSFADIP